MEDKKLIDDVFVVVNRVKHGYYSQLIKEDTSDEILLKVGAKYPKVDYVGKYSRFLRHIIPSNDETSCKATLLK